MAGLAIRNLARASTSFPARARGFVCVEGALELAPTGPKARRDFRPSLGMFEKKPGNLEPDRAGGRRRFVFLQLPLPCLNRIDNMLGGNVGQVAACRSQ